MFWDERFNDILQREKQKAKFIGDFENLLK